MDYFGETKFSDFNSGTEHIRIESWFFTVQTFWCCIGINNKDEYVCVCTKNTELNARLKLIQICIRRRYSLCISPSYLIHGMYVSLYSKETLHFENLKKNAHEYNTIFIFTPCNDINNIVNIGKYLLTEYQNK